MLNNPIIPKSVTRAASAAAAHQVSNAAAEIRSSQILSNTLRLWKAPTPAAGLNTSDSSGGSSRPGGGSEHGPTTQQLSLLAQKLTALEAKVDKQQSMLRELSDRIGRTDDDMAAAKNDLLGASHHVENTSIELQRQQERLSGLQDQLGYLSEQFARQSGGAGGLSGSGSSSSAVSWMLLGWLYVPLVFFLKGVWVVVYPFVATFQKLSFMRAAATQPRSSGPGARDGAGGEDDNARGESTTEAVVGDAGEVNGSAEYDEDHVHGDRGGEDAAARASEDYRASGNGGRQGSSEAMTLLDLLMSGQLDPTAEEGSSAAAKGRS